MLTMSQNKQVGMFNNRSPNMHAPSIAVLARYASLCLFSGGKCLRQSSTSR
uniref:Uncharacterized protein n=1 Tax=Arion vulgaris TaxID=1028688 RepID=A0A0B6YK89_9EUPU